MGPTQAEMLSSREGTFFVVLRFPHPWPPRTRARLLQVRRESGTLDLNAEPDGTLVFLVADQEARLEHRTQRLALNRPGWTILSATWSSGAAELTLGGEILLPHDAAGGVQKVVRTTEHPVGADPAWRDPNAPSACSRWITWRARSFGSAKQQPRAGRRLKTGKEQVQELLQAARIIQDLSVLIQRGHAHLLGHLAAELRALIYWNGRHYDPLLLRLAARAGVPLPIYMIRNDAAFPAEDSLSIHVRRGEPSILQVIPSQVIVDLQDWLESAVLSERGAMTSGEGVPAGLSHLSVKDLIAGVADTLGAAHYDQDLPCAIENLARVEGPVANEVILVLLVAASVVGPLSQYVITALTAGNTAT